MRRQWPVRISPKISPGVTGNTEASDPPVTIAATSATAQPIMRLAHRVVLAGAGAAP